MAMEENGEDRFSELPDGIILKITSCLTMKEAAATSLISTRWRDLWKLYSGCFDFEDSDNVRISLVKVTSYSDWVKHCTSSFKKLSDSSTLVTKWKNFVDRVNHVLRSHQGATMEGLRIISEHAGSSSEVIDSWVQLALVKRVQFIELDLTSFEASINPSIRYHFPIGSHYSFQSLKTLIFRYVEISGDALESLVDNCPNLEELNVSCSASLKVFKLSSLSLKYLTLCKCGGCFDPIMDLKISASNLLSFVWTGCENSNLVLEDVPQLKYANLTGYWYHIRSHHSQLHQLVLDCGNGRINQENNNIPELSNLKHLTMKYYLIDDRSFRLIVAYLEVAPLLTDVTLELQISSQGQDAKLSEAVLKMTTNYCYKNLKTLEFKGFGVENDVEFITHLVNHAPLLEKIVIDPCPRNYLGNFQESEYKLTTTYLEVRERAINLSASLACQVIVV